MSWLKLSDDFGYDCQDAGLSDAAFRLHVEGLLYVMEKETEGRIEFHHIRRFATNYAEDGVAEGIEELLQARYVDARGVERTFWEHGGDHYRVVHQMEHQPSRAQMQRRRALARENGKKGGSPAKPSSVPGAEPGREPVWEPQAEPARVSRHSAEVETGNETDLGYRHGNPEGRAGVGIPLVTACASRPNFRPPCPLTEERSVVPFGVAPGLHLEHLVPIGEQRRPPVSVAVPEGPEVIKSALEEGAEVVDVQLHLPRSVARQVLEVLEAQDSGGAHVVPLKEEYTTTEAAQLLGMSRPTLMRFIKRGEIPHRMVGQHHRIPADALETFRKQFRAEQATAAWDIAEISNQSNHF